MTAPSDTPSDPVRAAFEAFETALRSGDERAKDRTWRAFIALVAADMERAAEGAE